MTWCFDRWRSERRAAAWAAAAMLAFGACAAEETAAPAPEGIELWTAERPVARVGDRVFRLGDVAPDIGLRIYRHQVDIHSLVTHEAERLVDAELLAQEAARRGQTVDEVLAAEMDAAPPATDAEVDAWIAGNPGEAAMGAPARARVAHFLTEQRRIERRLAFLERLRAEQGVELLFDPPLRPRVRVDVGGAPMRGPEGAPVTLVHFAALDESGLASARMIGRILDAYPEAVRVAHQTFLGARDELALTAALAGYLAQDAGAFWTFHDHLASVEGPPSEQDVLAAAAAAGVEASVLEQHRVEGLELGRLRADIERGRRLGVDAPPVIFVNGRYFSPTYGDEALKQLVEQELGRVAAR